MIHFRLIVEKKALSRPSSESQMDLFLFGILWGQVRKANGEIETREEIRQTKRNVECRISNYISCFPFLLCFVVVIKVNGEV